MPFPVLKKGTAFLPTETGALYEDFVRSGLPETLQKNPKPPQFDPVTACHCGSNL